MLEDPTTYAESEEDEAIMQPWYPGKGWQGMDVVPPEPEGASAEKVPAGSPKKAVLAASEAGVSGEGMTLRKRAAKEVAADRVKRALAAEMEGAEDPYTSESDGYQPSDQGDDGDDDRGAGKVEMVVEERVVGALNIEELVDRRVQEKMQEYISATEKSLAKIKRDIGIAVPVPKAPSAGDPVRERLLKVQKLDKGETDCVVCKRSFKNTPALRKHFKNVHLSGRSWVCEICGTECATRALLEQHELIHANKGKFQCKFITNGTICGHRCNSKFALEGHFQAKHAGFSGLCRHCGLGMWSSNVPFTIEKSLKQHEDQCTSNQDAGPWFCPVCNKGPIARRREVQGHLKRCHGVKGPKAKRE